MPSIAVDTGPLIALYNRRDRHHAAVKTYFEAERRPLVTNVPVITETCQMLDFSSEAIRDFLSWVDVAFEVDRDLPDDFKRIAYLIAKYADLPADFADASLVAMCERLGIEQVATLDRDFEIYRTADGRALTNVLTQL